MMERRTSSVFHIVIITLLLASSGFLAAGGVSAHAGSGAEFLDTQIDSPPGSKLMGGFVYGANLLSGAESDTIGQSPFGWMVEPAGSLLVGMYGAPDMPMPTDPGPTDRGMKLFYTPDLPGSPCQAEYVTATKTYDLAGTPGLRMEAIQQGITPFRLAGWLGGPADTDDAVSLAAFFLDDDQRVIQRAVNEVFPEDDLNGRSGLIYRERTGTIPAGTRWVKVELMAFHPILDDCHPQVFADNLWFSIDKPEANVFLPAVINGTGKPPLPPTQPPVAPTGLSAVASGYVGIQLNWTAVSGANGYKIERSVSGVTGWQVLAQVDASQSGTFDKNFAFNADRFPFGKTLNYRVSAYNDAGSSSATQASLTIPAGPSSVPAKPDNCWVSNVTLSSAFFSWTDSSHNEENFSVSISQPELGVYDEHLANVEADATAVSIVDLEPGFATTLYVTAKNQQGESGACAVTFTPPAEGPDTYLRWTNAASYPVASLIVDGLQEFPVYPLAIVPGEYYEMPLDPGAHTAEVSLGWWDSRTSRFLMYTYWYEFSIDTGGWELLISDPSIERLMTQFGSEGYWEGYYFDGNLNCRTAAFRFKRDRTYTFYVSNVKQGTGEYYQVSRNPNEFTVHFNAGGQEGLLLETHGEFSMRNGPPGWPQITYNYKPQGYVYNPFCP